MRVLILGGSGFIGSAVAGLLASRGHAVTALARSVAVPSRRMPGIAWKQADIAALLAPEDWRPLIADADAIVNCAGALQDGARDDVAKLQNDAMLALYQAARGAGIRLIVQISARTDGGGADTPFLATKRSADGALKQSGAPFVILRPAVVVGRNAHGGTALLRALAGFPIVTPLLHGDTPMRFVALDDVCEAVAGAIDGDIASGGDLDLASGETLTLVEAVALHRRWLGLKSARVVAIPPFAAGLVTRIADGLGWLGWRSPLRSTAVDIAAGGVTGHATPPARTLKTLARTLHDAPAGVQDLWFARLYLMKPVIFATLSLFWLLSGIFALLSFGSSSRTLLDAGVPPAAAAWLTLFTSVLDIALGVAVVVQRHASMALKGMIGVSLAYLAAATLLTPELWTDPLGPLLKVIPSIVLALVALAILDER